MLEPEKWISRYASYLLNYAFFRVKDKETAEDLLQETFISALRSKDKYNGDCSEKTWLTIILKNKIIDHYRSKQYKQLQVTDSIDKFYDSYFNVKDGDHWQEDKQPQEWGDAARPLEQKELSAVLINCMSKMPEKLAAVFTLKYMEDVQTETICKDLQITSSNYWVMMHRAKIQLRECMEKNWFRK